MLSPTTNNLGNDHATNTLEFIAGDAAASADAGECGEHHAAARRAQAQSASVLNIATSGDPGPLDPTPVTSDLLSEITQLFYETLYIFGPDYSIAPLLAAELPEISDGGKRYIIKLRSGVPYHDGSTMNADDVVASLQRWGRLVAARANAVGAFWTPSRRRIPPPSRSC